jgi:hypothetical protein
MAGLIQQQMNEGAPAMAGGQAEGDVPDDSNPAFQQAMGFAMEVLYDKGAAKDIAEQLRSAQSPVSGAADIAYEVTSVVDERTDGQVPDELLTLLAMNVLEEVVEISDAAGIKMAPVEIADAFKQMLLRYLGEQGMDTTQLQQAMDEADPAVFEQAAAGEVGVV